MKMHFILQSLVLVSKSHNSRAIPSDWQGQQHRRGCSSCIHCKHHPCRGTVGCIWYRETSAEQRYPYYCISVRLRESFCFALFPRPNWMCGTGRGKKTTATLLTLFSLPKVVDDARLTVIERFSILIYNCTSNLTTKG